MTRPLPAEIYARWEKQEKRLAKILSLKLPDKPYAFIPHSEREAWRSSIITIYEVLAVHLEQSSDWELKAWLIGDGKE